MQMIAYHTSKGAVVNFTRALAGASLKVQPDFDSTIRRENAGRLEGNVQPYPRTRTGNGCNVAF
jgi:hypothetical protein